MSKPKIVEVGYVESSYDLGGFLGEAYRALLELRREAEALGLDLPDFPDCNFNGERGSLFGWLESVGASTGSPECNEESGAPGGSGVGRLVYYPLREEKAIERKARQDVERAKQIIMVHLLRKHGLADMEPVELDEFLSAATDSKPPEC